MFNQSRWSKQVLIVGVVACAVFLAVAFPEVGHARPQAVAPPLGKAQSFAVLGGSTVTNTGSSTVNGDLGVWPGTAITGFPPGLVVPPGTIHPGDAAAHQAQNAVTTVYNNLAGQACNFDLTGQDLGGKTLTPGVYCFSTSAQLTGVLTLDAQGDPNAVFVFQLGSTLTTASNSSVLVINSASGCNVFWQIGTSATLGTTTAFKGNIIALASITLNTSVNIDSGRALARNGAVTMDTNNVSITACATAPTKTPLPATQTAVAPTETAIALTQTVVATQTAFPQTATQTAIAATQTSIAATQTVVGATQTAIAQTVAPTLTAQAATLTATAMTPPPTKTPPPTNTQAPILGTPTRTPRPGGPPGATSVPTVVVVATATPTATVPILLPTTGGSGSVDLGLVWFALAVAGAALIGFPLLLMRHR
jgi:hypothetical protein